MHGGIDSPYVRLFWGVLQALPAPIRVQTRAKPIKLNRLFCLASPLPTDVSTAGENGPFLTPPALRGSGDPPAAAGLPPQQAKSRLAGDPGLETGATGSSRV
jgi:hypothetical protein